MPGRKLAMSLCKETRAYLYTEAHDVYQIHILWFKCRQYWYCFKKKHVFKILSPPKAIVM